MPFVRLVDAAEAVLMLERDPAPNTGHRPDGLGLPFGGELERDQHLTPDRVAHDYYREAAPAVGGDGVVASSGSASLPVEAFSERRVAETRLMPDAGGGGELV